MRVRAPQQLDLRRAAYCKGARIVASYAAAAGLAFALAHLAGLREQAATLFMLGANFALWACVSEMGVSRRHGMRLLAMMSVSAMLGAISFAFIGPLLAHAGPAAPEFALLPGAFAVGALKRFGPAGAGVGSQFYIGQMLAWSNGLAAPDMKLVLLAGLAAAVGTVLCRALLTERARPGEPVPAQAPWPDTITALEMGLQSAAGALLVLALDAVVGLKEPAWAVTACVYVIAGTPDQTLHRGRQRMLGTLVGVALGLGSLPLVYHLPWLAWVAAAAAMMLYTVSLPARYDFACGAYAFTLMVTLAAQGEHSLAVLAARAWETLLGAAIAMLLARYLRIARFHRLSSSFE